LNRKNYFLFILFYFVIVFVNSFRFMSMLALKWHIME